MRKFFLFLIGVVVGVIGTFGFLFLVVSAQRNNSVDGLTMFENDGECITTSNLRIFQTLAPDTGLAMKSPYGDNLVVLLVDTSGKNDYYDDKIVKVPKQKCARQIGTYKYKTKDERWKTVPVVYVEE
ncbi:MAG: hypothetical protein II942_02875 [Alphaproteobacteria bacterium]|nr:hypothetical protein [Alphaproteobacteria bacterium]